MNLFLKLDGAFNVVIFADDTVPVRVFLLLTPIKRRINLNVDPL